MTDTLDHRPQVITDYRTAGLKFYATGRKSATLRAIASDPELVRGFALLSGITVEQEREQALGIADAIDALEAEGMTPEQAYFLAGLDKLFGCPFSEFDPAAPVAA